MISKVIFAPFDADRSDPFLELVEPFELRGEGEEVRNEDMIANITGELARTCGAKFFETTFLYEDHSPTTEIAITPENRQAIGCIVTAAKQNSIQLNIIFRKANNAQTH